MEGDVDGAEADLDAAELLDQAAKPLGQRDAACVDADEGDVFQVGVALDDLVRDARERARERVGVEKDSRRRDVDAAHDACKFERDVLADTAISLLSGLTGPG